MYTCAHDSMIILFYPDQTCSREPYESSEIVVNQCSLDGLDSDAVYIESIFCPIDDGDENENKRNWLYIGIALVSIVVLILLVYLWSKCRNSRRRRDTDRMQMDELSNLTGMLNK